MKRLALLMLSVMLVGTAAQAKSWDVVDTKARSIVGYDFTFSWNAKNEASVNVTYLDATLCEDLGRNAPGPGFTCGPIAISQSLAIDGLTYEPGTRQIIYTNAETGKATTCAQWKKSRFGGWRVYNTRSGVAPTPRAYTENGWVTRYVFEVIE